MQRCFLPRSLGYITSIKNILTFRVKPDRSLHDATEEDPTFLPSENQFQESDHRPTLLLSFSQSAGIIMSVMSA